MFVTILSLTTLGIALVAEYFSIYGLANMFAAHFWPIVCMGAVLAIGKFVAVSYLYRYWSQTGLMLKTYLVSAILLLMLNTSMGIFGYLSAGYQLDTIPLKQAQQQIMLLESELDRLQSRKREIDGQISQLAPNDVIGKQRLDRVFFQENRNLTARIPQLTAELHRLKIQTITTESHVGPVIYISDAFGASTDNAMKYIILLLIFVFEPLAIVLSICLNVVIAGTKNTTVVDAVVHDNEFVTDSHSDDKPFANMAVDLLSRRLVEEPTRDEPASLVIDEVKHQPVAVTNDDHQTEVPSEHLEPTTIINQVEPLIVEPTIVEPSIDTPADVISTVVEMDEQDKQDPPKHKSDLDATKQPQRESILDRWLKQRQR